MGLKREIALLKIEKSLEDLYHTADVRLIGLDARERLDNILLDAMKHPSDNG